MRHLGAITIVVTFISASVRTVWTDSNNAGLHEKHAAREKAASLRPRDQVDDSLSTFNCAGRSTGYYADKNFDCKVFHFCHTDGSRVTISCQKGHSSSKHRICVFQEAAARACDKTQIFLAVPPDYYEGGKSTLSDSSTTTHSLLDSIPQPSSNPRDSQATPPSLGRPQEGPLAVSLNEASASQTINAKEKISPIDKSSREFSITSFPESNHEIFEVFHESIHEESHRETYSGPSGSISDSDDSTYESENTHNATKSIISADGQQTSSIGSSDKDKPGEGDSTITAHKELRKSNVKDKEKTKGNAESEKKVRKDESIKPKEPISDEIISGESSDSKLIEVTTKDKDRTFPQVYSHLSRKFRRPASLSWKSPEDDSATSTEPGQRHGRQRRYIIREINVRRPYTIIISRNKVPIEASSAQQYDVSDFPFSRPQPLNIPLPNADAEDGDYDSSEEDRDYDRVPESRRPPPPKRPTSSRPKPDYSYEDESDEYDDFEAENKKPQQSTDRQEGFLKDKQDVFFSPPSFYSPSSFYRPSEGQFEFSGPNSGGRSREGPRDRNRGGGGGEGNFQHLSLPPHSPYHSIPLRPIQTNVRQNPPSTRGSIPSVKPPRESGEVGLPQNLRQYPSLSPTSPPAAIDLYPAQPPYYAPFPDYGNQEEGPKLTRPQEERNINQFYQGPIPPSSSYQAAGPGGTIPASPNLDSRLRQIPDERNVNQYYHGPIPPSYQLGSPGGSAPSSQNHDTKLGQNQDERAINQYYLQVPISPPSSYQGVSQLINLHPNSNPSLQNHRVPSGNNPPDHDSRKENQNSRPILPPPTLLYPGIPSSGETLPHQQPVYVGPLQPGIEYLPQQLDQYLTQLSPGSPQQQHQQEPKQVVLLENPRALPTPPVVQYQPVAHVPVHEQANDDKEAVQVHYGQPGHGGAPQLPPPPESPRQLRAYSPDGRATLQEQGYSDDRNQRKPTFHQNDRNHQIITNDGHGESYVRQPPPRPPQQTRPYIAPEIHVAPPPRPSSVPVTFPPPRPPAAHRHHHHQRPIPPPRAPPSRPLSSSHLFPPPPPNVVDVSSDRLRHPRPQQFPSAPSIQPGTEVRSHKPPRPISGVEYDENGRSYVSFTASDARAGPPGIVRGSRLIPPPTSIYPPPTPVHQAEEHHKQVNVRPRPQPAYSSPISPAVLSPLPSVLPPPPPRERFPPPLPPRERVPAPLPPRERVPPPPLPPPPLPPTPTQRIPEFKIRTVPAPTRPPSVTRPTFPTFPEFPPPVPRPTRPSTPEVVQEDRIHTQTTLSPLDNQAREDMTRDYQRIATQHPETSSAASLLHPEVKDKDIDPILLSSSSSEPPESVEQSTTQAPRRKGRRRGKKRRRRPKHRRPPQSETDQQPPEEAVEVLPEVTSEVSGVEYSQDISGVEYDHDVSGVEYATLTPLEDPSRFGHQEDNSDIQTPVAPDGEHSLQDPVVSTARYGQGSISDDADKVAVTVEGGKTTLSPEYGSRIGLFNRTRRKRIRKVRLHTSTTPSSDEQGAPSDKIQDVQPSSSQEEVTRPRVNRLRPSSTTSTTPPEQAESKHIENVHSEKRADIFTEASHKIVENGERDTSRIWNTTTTMRPMIDKFQVRPRLFGFGKPRRTTASDTESTTLTNSVSSTETPSETESSK